MLEFTNINQKLLNNIPPLLIESTTKRHMEYTIIALLLESTPPLKGRKKPPCPDLLK